MQLKKFQEKKTKKKGIIIFTICCILLITGVVFSSSFALFEIKKNFNIVEGNMEQLGDISFTYYIDDKIALESPEKNSGKVFDSMNSYCTNGANIRWNYEEWGAFVTNIPTTKTKCFLKFKTQYSESLLNGADPILKEELIPVTIEKDGTVKKADLSEEWYKYENQRWANAVILKDASANNNYKEKEVIPESDIESYFVWIPRYRYKIFNEGNYTSLTATVTNNQIDNNTKKIEIVFENKDIAISTGTKINNWLTHPAFISFQSNGMWVGKFEPSKSINNELQIKPNEEAWGNILVADSFYTSYNYKRNLESHMMKNSEWGAVAYLSHSDYGSFTSIRINNNASHITGYAAKKEPTCGLTETNLECNRFCNDGSCNEPYNTEVGYLASTTRNITGIYDMSGGAWEYVMGVMLDQDGNLVSGRNQDLNSGFMGTFTDPTTKTSWTAEDGGLAWPDSRYYDTYIYNETYLNYERGHLGDATKEMGPFNNIIYDSVSGTDSGIGTKITRRTSSWYMDTAHFFYKNSPWLIRGGRAEYGNEAGIFNYYAEAGQIRKDYSFRVILAL